MALTLISTANQFNSQDHPLNQTDIKNRAGKELVSLMLAEHLVDGSHTTQNKGIVYEAKTYVGDGTGTQTIPLTATTLTPFLTVVFQDDTQYPYLRLSNFTANYSIAVGDLTGGSWTTSGITAENVGEFTVGADLEDIGVTYYYFVLGTLAAYPTFTGDAGAGSDPTYIQHGAALTGGIKSTMANSVEDAIFDIFDHEHNGTTGAHDASPLCIHELLAWTGDDVDGRTIYLSNTALDIKLIIGAYADTTIGNVYLRTESMPADSAKRVRAAGSGDFSLDAFQSLGTGEFEVGAVFNFSAASDGFFALVMGIEA